MSVAKPSEYPEWASGGSAVITEPSTPKKALGWIVEKPPYQFFNWLLNLTYGWIAWFDQGFKNIQAVTASGTTNVGSKSVHIMADCTAGNQTFQLPDVTGLDGVEYSITRIDSSGNSVTIQAITGKVISDAQAQTLNSLSSLRMVAYGGNLYLQ